MVGRKTKFEKKPPFTVISSLSLIGQRVFCANLLQWVYFKSVLNEWPWVSSRYLIHSKSMLVNIHVSLIETFISWLRLSVRLAFHTTFQHGLYVSVNISVCTCTTDQAFFQQENETRKHLNIPDPIMYNILIIILDRTNFIIVT